MEIIWLIITLFAVAIVIFLAWARMMLSEEDFSRKKGFWESNKYNKKSRNINREKRVNKEFFVSPEEDFSKLNKYDPTNPTGKSRYVVHPNHRYESPRANKSTYVNSNSFKKAKPNNVVKKNEEADLLFANLDKSISGQKVENKLREKINSVEKPVSSSNNNLIFSATPSKIKDAKIDPVVKIQTHKVKSNKVVNNVGNEDLLFSGLDKSISNQKVQKFKTSINEETRDDIPSDNEDIAGGLF